MLWLQESKKLECVSREKSTLSETHWLLEKLRDCLIKGGFREGRKGGERRRLPSLKAEDRPAQAEREALDALGGVASPAHVF